MRLAFQQFLICSSFSLLAVFPAQQFCFFSGFSLLAVRFWQLYSFAVLVVFVFQKFSALGHYSFCGSFVPPKRLLFLQLYAFDGCTLLVLFHLQWLWIFSGCTLCFLIFSMSDIKPSIWLMLKPSASQWLLTFFWRISSSVSRLSTSIRTEIQS